MPTNNTYSGSITLVKVSDGLSADSYYIETDYSEILRFETEAGVEFSPPAISFKVLDLKNNSQPLDQFSWNFSYLDHEKGKFEVIAEDENNQYPTYFSYTSSGAQETIEEGASSRSGSEESVGAQLTFYIQDFYTYVKSNTNSSNQTILKYLENLGQGVAFKFTYVKNGKTTAIKIISCQNGVSADLAQLHIGAADISAAIREASLKFSANGLSLQNGDFKIIKKFYKQLPSYVEFNGTQIQGQEYYEKTQDGYEKVTGNFEENKQYYIIEEANPNEDSFGENGAQYYYLDSNGSYQLADAYSEGTIYFKQTEEPVLYTEEDNLAIKGNIYADNGYFKGKVEATEGSFTGYINSSGGNIGGFLIDGNKISSGGIKLVSAIGQEGSYIEAGEIFLGNAYLQNKLVISSEEGKEIAGLYNPNAEGNTTKTILKSGQISLTADGHFSLGKIDMYAGSEDKLDGYIRANGVDEDGMRQNGFWRINEDGTAYFDEIYLKEAHIQNSILEINSVQSVGSLMIFKDSWPIVEISEDLKSLKLKGRTNLNNGDWIYSGKEYYVVEECEPIVYYEKENAGEGYIETQDLFFSEGKKYYNKVLKNETETYEESLDTEFCSWIILTRKYEDSSRVLTKFGKSSDPNTNERGYILSIFGEKGDITNKMANSFATGNSLTISSFSVSEGEEQNLMFTKHLILGNLNNTGIDELSNMNGWGLYCDNVFLKGSLVTKIPSDSINSAYYSGINTASTIQFAKKPESLPAFDDSSNIIFWGGATNAESEQIANAPFQVTAKGTLYAQNAIIENSTFSGSIYSSEIHTAKIYGEDSGLAIYDSAKGISFMQANDDYDRETYSINTNGLSHGEKQFISIPSDTTEDVTFQGIFQTPGTEQSIKVTNDAMVLKTFEHVGKILLKNEAENKDSGALCLGVGDSQQLIIREALIDIEASVAFAEDIWFGTDIQFKKVARGYDVYVYET